MAEHPDEALQEAVVAALEADASLRMFFSGKPRVFDRVPKNALFPYIQIGEIQIVDDSNCIPAWETYVTTHIWSEKPGKKEAQAIGKLVGPALNVELTIPGFVCTVFEFRDARYLTDNDGLTTHGVLTHRYLIDQA